jgi:hypothetical protein
LRIGALDSTIPALSFLYTYIALLARFQFWNPVRSKVLPKENRFLLNKIKTLKIYRN